MTVDAMHRLLIRIYYEDTDFSGIVYHASYLRFMERARTEWLRQLGIDQRAAFAMTPPIAFVVRRIAIEFAKPARMDDEIVVETELCELRGASLVLNQRVLRAGELLVEARVTVATLSGGRATRIPAQIRRALASRRSVAPIDPIQARSREGDGAAPLLTRAIT
jgi:acyl-CoA thioester hydrolase